MLLTGIWIKGYLQGHICKYVGCKHVLLFEGLTREGSMPPLCGGCCVSAEILDSCARVCSCPPDPAAPRGGPKLVTDVLLLKQGRTLIRFMHFDFLVSLSPWLIFAMFLLVGPRSLRSVTRYICMGARPAFLTHKVCVMLDKLWDNELHN